MAPKAHLQQSASELSEALRMQALFLLTAPAVAALRSTCHAMKALVDKASARDLEPAAAELLPAGLLEQAATDQDVMQMLQQQQACISSLRSRLSPRPVPIATHDFAKAQKLLWSPAWPCLYLVVLMASSSEMAIHAVKFELPAAAQQWLQVIDLTSMQPLPAADSSM